MKEEIKDAWVAALRSGKYTQTKGVLRRNDSFCCLGVLCDLAKEQGYHLEWEIDTTIEDGIVWNAQTNVDSRTCLLPFDIADWAGLSSDAPSYRSDIGHEGLASLNDAGYDFDGIAKVIEDNWEQL